MQFRVPRLNPILPFVKQNTILSNDDNRIRFLIKKTHQGYVLQEPSGRKLAEISDIDYENGSAVFPILLNGAKWLVLKRPWIFLWYVSIHADPDIVKLKRNPFTFSFQAFFNDNWELTVNSKLISTYYQVIISNSDQIIKGLAFALAMDLATQIHTSDVP